MQLTEIIQVDYSERFSELCWLAKKLYNKAHRYIILDYEHLENILSYYDLDYILKTHQEYKNLPAQTSQQILMNLKFNWKAYFKGLKSYKKDYTRFKKKPKKPNYKNKESTVFFTNQQCRIKEGYLHFPKKVNIDPIKTRITSKINQVRIVPLNGIYKIEIIYEKEIIDLGLDKNNILGIDMGITNIIAGATNTGNIPFIVKGGVFKSINQYFNKQLAYYRSIESKKGNFRNTKRMNKLFLDRNNKIDTHFHIMSKYIINYCKKNDIGTIVIGYIQGWKQKANMGKKTNQKFIQIPYLQLINKIKYKSELVGIDVKTINESHTSKCSFLDNEEIKHHDKYKGKRIKRGMFISSTGIPINADINAAYNIIKKTFPNSISIDGRIKHKIIPKTLSYNNWNMIKNKKEFPNPFLGEGIEVSGLIPKISCDI